MREFRKNHATTCSVVLSFQISKSDFQVFRYQLFYNLKLNKIENCKVRKIFVVLKITFQTHFQILEPNFQSYYGNPFLKRNLFSLLVCNQSAGIFPVSRDTQLDIGNYTSFMVMRTFISPRFLGSVHQSESDETDKLCMTTKTTWV